MPPRLINFWVAFIIFSCSFCAALSIKKGYYTIIVPQTVRQASVFNVSFTLNDFHKSCWFNISYSNDNDDIFPKILKENVEVEPGSTKLVELQAPTSFAQAGYIIFTGYRGIITKETATIFFEPEQYLAFIQTNKYKYKPGELVQFRVICIDQLKRPANVKEKTTIEIYDYQYNLIKTIIDVKFIQGVFRSEFQLSDYPVLGVWTINVRIGDINLADRIFEVDRYEVPNFNVKITTKNAVFIDEDQIEFEINARYFYGEPVKRNLSITINYIGVPRHTSPPTSPPTFTREFEIDGKIIISIDLKNDLQLKKENETQKSHNSPIELYQFYIEAIVIDSSSEEQFYTTTKFEVRSQPYTIILECPEFFSSDSILNIEVKVSIKDLEENLIEDTRTPIEIIVGCHHEEYKYYSDDFDIFRIEYKNKIGRDFAVIEVQNINYMECYLYAEYQRIRSYRRWIRRRVFELKLDVLTRSPEEGKELQIKITSPEPIEEFSYEIQSRGDIIQSDHVNVFGNQTTYILHLNVTFSMVPKITIYIHHIQNMNFGGVFKDIIIKRAFHNLIEIETVKETNPGASVNINVTTDEGSYVGLMGLDTSTLESIDKKDILNTNFVNCKLSSVNRLRYPYPIPLHGGKVGDITVLSNIFRPTFSVKPKAGFPGIIQRTRRLFPESWLYLDFERTPAGGLKIMETVPDAITTWAITGFSIHPDTGLTFTKNTTNLRVFQEFFISMDFPNFVKEGEIIGIPIYINNYMNQDALTNLKIESNSDDLEILENPESISKSKFNISKLISSKKREKLLVFFKSLKSGNYNVTVEAISSLATDSIQKTLNVKSQGIPYAKMKTYLVLLPERSTQEDEITIDIPENAVAGSQRIEVSVVGDIFQPLMTKLQKLARVPYGNAEDNMRLIVSNAIVLKYLKALNYTNPSLENKIRFNLELGYQNQLSFKYLDGSFGLVERTIARTGDIWQTVLALWGLNLAKDFIHIDPRVIERGLQYLKSKQQENGCYKSGSGTEEDVKFTAIGLIVFLMDEHSRTTYSEVIIKGLGYLFDVSDDLESSPISAMATYVLLLGNHGKVADQLRKLVVNSRLTNKQFLWTKSDTLQSHLQTTAGNLINLFEYQELPEQSLLHIVKGLIVSKRKDSSTTHMLALQAMEAFVEKLFLNRKDINITFKDDRNKTSVFHVHAENSQVLQTFAVSQSSRKLNIQSKGHGFAVVNVKYQYNLIPENQSSSIYNTNISTVRTSNHNFSVLKICLASKTSLRKVNVLSNETSIMEVSLQSGYIFTEKDIQLNEKLNEIIKAIQFNTNRDKVIVHFDDNTYNDNACVELEVRKYYKVFNSKPGWVVVYDTDDEDEKTAKSFQINDDL